MYTVAHLFAYVAHLCAHWHIYVHTWQIYLHTGTFMCIRGTFMCTLAHLCAYVAHLCAHVADTVTCLLPTVYDDSSRSEDCSTFESFSDYITPDYRATLLSDCWQNMPLSVTPADFLTDYWHTALIYVPSYQLLLLLCDSSDKSAFNCSDWSGNGICLPSLVKQFLRNITLLSLVKFRSSFLR